MADLKIFENPAFGQVRTLELEGEPWFVGKDVAQALGYSNTRDALDRHVDDEDKNTVVNPDGNSHRGKRLKRYLLRRYRKLQRRGQTQ